MQNDDYARRKQIQNSIEGGHNMTNVDQAIKFCETLAKDQEFIKQYADAYEFEMKELLDMLREYKCMQERYDKYAYVCKVMPNDLYYELCSQYESNIAEMMLLKHIKEQTKE